ncbi:MAG: Rid family hydrolase, partial [Candidatus Bathyarchaeia archaeon]
YFATNPPARSTVQVAKLVSNFIIEIEAVAHVP